jgi:magnesium transporter
MQTKHRRPSDRAAKAGKPYKPPGSSPGSLVYTGEKKQDAVCLQLIQFTEDAIHASTATDIGALLGKLDASQVNWINVSGLHDTFVVESLGSHFKIDPLVLEDILHTEHMPKLEEHDNYLFLTLKILTHCDERNSIEREHVSMLLGDSYLITFQEKTSGVFDVIHELLGNGKGRMRKRKADYLFYRLLDTIVDHYGVILDGTEDKLSFIEEELLENTGAGISERIIAGKKNMLLMRRTVLPLRDAMRLFKQRDVPLITESTYGFLDDVSDHLLHMSQTIEHSRELLTGLMELHMAVNANKMNNVMKTLTVFAAIFMPLTFLAGIYGMNFEFMPELGWRWAYPLVLIVMALIAGVMILFMHRRKWL